MFRQYDRVLIPGIGEGRIEHIRYDDNKYEIYDIVLDNGQSYVARDVEMKLLSVR
jgi:hypothetical protein